jgi:hypothetical protein
MRSHWDRVAGKGVGRKMVKRPLSVLNIILIYNPCKSK